MQFLVVLRCVCALDFEAAFQVRLRIDSLRNKWRDDPLENFAKVNRIVALLLRLEALELFAKLLLGEEDDVPSVEV